MKLSTTGLAAAVLSVLALAAPSVAGAAPATVKLRIEGPTKTLFEGPVTTDVRQFRFTGDMTSYRCDGTDANGGPSAAPVPTRGAAVAEASERTPFTTKGTFSTSLGSPSFSEIAGENVAFDPDTNKFLGEYKNGQFSNFGSCGDPVTTGDDVLFAYGDGSEQLLALAGPADAKSGDTVRLNVTDTATKAPVAGAAVGDRQTDAAGNVDVVVPETGLSQFKATKPGAIRSNRVEVRIRDVVRPVGRVLGISEGQSFSRTAAPRQLHVSATDASGIKRVRLRLTRSYRGKCQYLSGSLERLRTTTCGRSFPFTASMEGDFTYLLPARLGPGRYVLDAIATYRASNRDLLARGRSRIVFFVR